jgi:hypothetical protein
MGTLTVPPVPMNERRLRRLILRTGGAGAEEGLHLRTLAETRYLSDLAKALYPWLPGSNHPHGRAYTFADAASEVGLPTAWQGGSKLPALQHLLDVAFDRAELRSLVLAVFREGIKYRDRGSDPVSREDVTSLSSITRALGLGLPELEDPSLLASLPARTKGAAPSRTVESRPVVLDGVKVAYEKVKSNPDAQARGYEFQDFLQLLFAAYDLEPQGSFRVVGEEIDGSFLLDSETYLLEARWRAKPTAKADLAVFQSKITGKSTFSRGAFLSMGPFQVEALEEFNRGKAPGFVVVSRRELEETVAGRDRLDLLLRRKVRKVAEKGILTVDQ